MKKILSLSVAFIFFFNITSGGFAVAFSSPGVTLPSNNPQQPSFTQHVSQVSPESGTCRFNAVRRAPGFSLEQDREVSASQAVDPELEVLAKTCGHDISGLFSYVRDNMDYQPYYGSMKGPLGTYLEQAGNDVDQSSLLVALFQVSDIPARYVAGVIGLPIEVIINWVGVETPEAAVEVFASNGIPSQAALDANNNITGILFNHIWVEAYDADSDAWIGLDPSFKQYTYHEGIDAVAAAGIDAQVLYDGIAEGASIGDDLLDNLNMENFGTIVQGYQDNVQESLPEGATLEEVTGYRTISDAGNGMLPSPAYSFSEEIRFDWIPASFLYRVRYEIAGIDYTTSTSALVNKSVSVEYTPATQEDADKIDQVGGSIYDVTAYEVKMRPTLRINGEVVAEGTESEKLGESQILYSSFMGPQEDEWSTDERRLTVGAGYSLVLGSQRMSVDMFDNRLAALDAAAAEYQDDDIAPLELVEELRHLMGIGFFVATDTAGEIMARSSGIVWTRRQAHLIIAQDLSLNCGIGSVISVGPGPWSFDVQRNVLNPVSVNGDAQAEVAWLFSKGANVSAMEAEVLRVVFGCEVASAATVLDAAARRQSQIYTITADNADELIPCLRVSLVVRESIEAAIAQGWSAICPKSRVQMEGWEGSGWVEWDPATGHAHFYIYGSVAGDGLARSAQDILGGSMTEENPDDPGIGSILGDLVLGLHGLQELLIPLWGIPACMYGIYSTWGAGLFVRLLGLWAFGGLAALLGICAWLVIAPHLKAEAVFLRRRYRYCETAKVS